MQTTGHPGEVPVDRGMQGHRLRQPPVAGGLTIRPVRSPVHSDHITLAGHVISMKPVVV